MTQKPYARLYKLDDETRCYELLDDHLALTSFIMLLLCLRSPWCRRDDGYVRAAVLIGLLHDIGKALRRYQRANVYRLSFGDPPHEEISAHIASFTISKVQMDQSMLWAVVKAIEMHHQGLRLLTFWESRKAVSIVRELSENDVNEVNKCIDESVDLLEKILSGIEPNYDIPSNYKGFVNQLREVLRFDPKYRLLPPCSADIIIVKLFTGMLIVADYFATRLNLLRVNSRCISDTLIANEIHNYLKSFGIDEGNVLDALEKILGNSTNRCRC